jgi:hypothetical protein
MHLIQILLPLTEEKAASASTFGQLREELTAKFGGLTFHRNAPAQGLWDDAGEVQEDTIVIAEVMAEEVDYQWWQRYREELEGRFQQKEIVIRAITATRL